MTFRKGIFPFGLDPAEPDAETASHDAGILFGAFEDTFRFVTDADVTSTGSHASSESADFQATTDAPSLTFDELTLQYPGIVWPSLFGQSSATAGDSGLQPDATSQDDAGGETQQDTSFAAIDWRLTPDYDDDPGWYPGVIWQPLSEQLSSAVQDIVSTNPVLQDVVERASSLVDELSSLYPGIVWPPLLGQGATPDEGVAAADTEVPAVSNGDDTQTATSSLTYAEVSAQYPGIVWPADWYLL